MEKVRVGSKIDPSAKDPRGYHKYIHMKSLMEQSPVLTETFLELSEMKGLFTRQDAKERFVKKTGKNTDVDLFFFSSDFGNLSTIGIVEVRQQPAGELKFRISEKAWVKTLKEDILKEESCDTCDM